MSSILAIKEDKKDLEVMQNKTNEELGKLSKREMLINYLSFQICRADEHCEWNKIGTKAIGMVAKFIPDSVVQSVGVIFSNPITDGVHNLYRELKRGIIKGGAAIVGISPEELFVYDFKTGEKLPAFENYSNMLDTLIGDPDKREELLAQFGDLLPVIKTIFKDEGKVKKMEEAKKMEKAKNNANANEKIEER